MTSDVLLYGVVSRGYKAGSDMDGTWVGNVGGQINITPMWGVVGEVQVIEDVTQYSAGVRASF